MYYYYVYLSNMYIKYMLFLHLKNTFIIYIYKFIVFVSDVNTWYIFLAYLFIHLGINPNFF